MTLGDVISNSLFKSFLFNTLSSFPCIVLSIRGHSVTPTLVSQAMKHHSFSTLCLLHHRIDLSLILCDSISISFEARLCSLFSWRRTEGILQEKLELSSIYSLSFSSFRSILFVASFLFWSLIPNTSSLPSNLFRSSFFS